MPAMSAGGAVPVTDLDEADPPPRNGKRTRRAIGAIGLVAVVLVGGFAAIALRGDAGGASSPEAAVRQLADAVDHEDVLAAVDVLAPEEVTDLRDTVDAARQRAAELKLVQSTSQPFAGIDLSVRNLQLSVDEIVDGYAKVTISGTIHADANRSGLSPYLRDTLGAQSASGDFDLSQMSINGNKPFLMAVRSGGNWYVSPAYTAFESLRLANNLPGADLGSAVQTRDLGAATPDDAVQQLVHAVQAGDWLKVASLADPEGFPMYDYRDAFTKLMHDNFGTPDFTIDKLTTTSTVNGNRGTVDLDTGGTYGGDPSQTWSIAHGCLSSSATENTQGIESGVPSVCAGSLFASIAAFGPPTSTAQAPPVEISVVRRDGRWFVAPATTAFDAVREWLPQIDQRLLATLTNHPLAIPVDGTLRLDQPQTLATTGPLRPTHYSLTIDHDVSVIPGVGADEQSLGYATIYKGSAPLEPNGPNGELALTAGTYDVIAYAYTSGNAALTVFTADKAPEWAKQESFSDSGAGGVEGTCTYGANGGEMCSSTATTSTVPAP
jgi:hypothetical protein